jgi:hypothetical protein
VLIVEPRAEEACRLLSYSWVTSPKRAMKSTFTPA